MRKKDYELIAEVIAENHRFNLIEDEQMGSDIASITRLLAQELATAFEAEGYKFDRQKFLTACGIETCEHRRVTLEGVCDWCGTKIKQ